jgi:Lon protease-like protein
MNRTLPLFPLDMVLFPLSTASLQIFETRYREMLRDCMAADRRFGIVLIKGGRDSGQSAEPFSIGTVAHITEIGAPRRGAIPIEIVGETRFKILEESRLRSYLTANVEVLEEDPEDMASDAIVLAAHVATLRYLGTVLASQGVYKADPRIPKNPVRLSYYMGMVATTARNRALQQLLETERVSDRLQAGIALLEEEADRLQTAFMRSGPGRERSLFSRN